MGETLVAESIGFAPRTDIDGNSPTAEGVCLAHMQVMDAFDAIQREALLSALDRALGPAIPEATSEPNEPNRLRGGSYLLGSMHRRAWRVTWDELPSEMHRSLDAADLSRVKAIPAELVVHWADHLPFAIVLIRAQPGQQSQWIAYAAESLLAALPGRLGPNNRTPRSESQLLLTVKISDERMKRIREAMNSRSDDETLRRDIAEGLQLIGNAAGHLELNSPFSNVLCVEGQGSMILGDNEGPQGPFRAFVFSSGNLGPHRGYDWHIPMWIPSNAGWTSWLDFNFHPFLYAAIRNAEHVGVEAGILDEELSNTSRRLPRTAPSNFDRTASGALHGDLVRLHAQLQALETVLHLGASRSPVIPAADYASAGNIRYALPGDTGWPMMGSSSSTSESLKAAKVQAERNAGKVLDGLGRRIDRALDLVTTVENYRLNSSMRFWTIVSASLALLAIAIAAFRP